MISSSVTLGGGGGQYDDCHIMWIGWGSGTIHSTRLRFLISNAP